MSDNVSENVTGHMEKLLCIYAEVKSLFPLQCSVFISIIY